MNSKELWLFLFLTGFIFFNWPFLDIFGLSLPYYLFCAWGVFIIIVSFFITKATKQKRQGV